jgi:prepilin-type N-terminal cleavage/methylation domain-containing protein
MKKQFTLQSDKGFTLVELVVSLLVTGILLGTVTSVFLMSQKLYTRGESIAYKQKSIYNIETDLQNALAIATVTGVQTGTNPAGNYKIGFKDGVFVEIIGGQTYQSGQISKVKLTVANTNTMYYEITPKDTTMSTLTGGIVMNNVKTSPFSSVTLDGGTNNNTYVGITYETGS